MLYSLSLDTAHVARGELEQTQIKLDPSVSGMSGEERQTWTAAQKSKYHIYNMQHATPVATLHLQRTCNLPESDAKRQNEN